MEVTLTENFFALEKFLGFTQELFSEIPRSVLCLVEQSHHLQNVLRKKDIPCCVIKFYVAYFHVSFSTLLLDLFFFTDLLEQVLKNEFLNRQVFKNYLFSVFCYLQVI